MKKTKILLSKLGASVRTCERGEAKECMQGELTVKPIRLRRRDYTTILFWVQFFIRVLLSHKLVSQLRSLYRSQWEFVTIKWSTAENQRRLVRVFKIPSWQRKVAIRILLWSNEPEAPEALKYTSTMKTAVRKSVMKTIRQETTA